MIHGRGYGKEGKEMQNENPTQNKGLADQIREKMEETRRSDLDVARELTPAERVSRDARVFMRDHWKRQFSRWVEFAEKREREARGSIDSALLELDADAAKAKSEKEKLSIYSDVLQVEGLRRWIDAFSAGVAQVMAGVEGKTDTCPVSEIRGAVSEIQSHWFALQKRTDCFFKQTGIPIDI